MLCCHAGHISSRSSQQTYDISANIQDGLVHISRTPNQWPALQCQPHLIHLQLQRTKVSLTPSMQTPCLRGSWTWNPLLVPHHSQMMYTALLTPSPCSWWLPQYLRWKRHQQWWPYIQRWYLNAIWWMLAWNYGRGVTHQEEDARQQVRRGGRKGGTCRWACSQHCCNWPQNLQSW